MQHPNRFSIKSFSADLDSRLEALSADALRDVLRVVARQIAPGDRQAFLDRLRPQRHSTKDLESQTVAATLLDDIDRLEKRLSGDMKHPERHYDSWRGEGTRKPLGGQSSGSRGRSPHLGQGLGASRN